VSRANAVVGGKITLFIVITRTYLLIRITLCVESACLALTQ